MLVRDIREQRIGTRAIGLAEATRSERVVDEEVRWPPLRIGDPDQAQRLELVGHRLRSRARLAQRHASKEGKLRRRLARHLGCRPRHGQRGLAPVALGHEAVVRQVNREVVAVAPAAPRLAPHEPLLRGCPGEEHLESRFGFRCAVNAHGVEADLVESAVGEKGGDVHPRALLAGGDADAGLVRGARAGTANDALEIDVRVAGVPRLKRTASKEVDDGRHLLLRQHAHLQVERRKVGRARLVRQVRGHDQHVQGARVGGDRHVMQFLHREAQGAGGGIELGGAPHPARVAGAPLPLAFGCCARRLLLGSHLRAHQLLPVLRGGHRESRPGAVPHDVQIAHPHAIATDGGQGHHREGLARLAIPADQHLPNGTSPVPCPGVIIHNFPAIAPRHHFGLHHLRVRRQRGANHLRRHQAGKSEEPATTQCGHVHVPFSSPVRLINLTWRMGVPPMQHGQDARACVQAKGFA